MVENWFQSKNDISHLHSHNYHWSKSLIGHENSFHMAIGWISLVFFVKGFLRFLANHFNIFLLICLSGLRFAQYRCTNTILVLHIEAYFNSPCGCFSWMRLAQEKIQPLRGQLNVMYSPLCEYVLIFWIKYSIIH